MQQGAWALANLNDDQLKLIREAEHTLGADYLLAYRPEMTAARVPFEAALSDLKAAGLDESQVECLRGLEARLDAVIVAYEKTS